jgi:hypothetical protein
MSTELFVARPYNRSARTSETALCIRCNAAPRRSNANKCKDCYNAAKRAKRANPDNPHPPRRKNIITFLAVEEHLAITASTVVHCYYCQPFRVCIFAHRRTDAMKWMKLTKGVTKESFIEKSVCSISEIDVNMTDIDLTQYGWKHKGTP